VSVPPEIFGKDYLYFYADVLGGEQSDADTEVIARLLSLAPSMRVLDVPCGEGRISGRMARLGCEVVGVDNSETMLGLARERYPDVRFEHADMRELVFEAEFDAVVNWFTSFGYFEPPDNDRVLAAFARALRPGGRLLLEMHNPWRLARALEISGGSSGYVVERDGDILADRFSYDEGTRRSRTERFVVRDGRLQKLEFLLEQVPAPELIRRLARAGFGEVTLFGHGGEPFQAEGRRLIAVAQRGPGPRRRRVTLREVNDENARAVCELKLAPGQETYVAPSAYTLAEAAADPRAWVRAIYADDAPVGVLCLLVDAAAPRYFLVRMMIGAEHQGRGFGREAVRMLTEHVRSLPGARTLETSCVPGPASPIGFYRRLGFADTGRVENAENLLALTL
jgi:SAM-dependent methyltransferase